MPYCQNRQCKHKGKELEDKELFEVPFMKSAKSLHSKGNPSQGTEYIITIKYCKECYEGERFSNKIQ